MDTLSQRVAEVLRRELAGDQVDWAAFAKDAGMPKTTVWRKLNGSSKISVDDAAALASGLGWTLPQLLERAGGADPLTPRSAAGKDALEKGRAKEKPAKRRRRRGPASTG